MYTCIVVTDVELELYQSIALHRAFCVQFHLMYGILVIFTAEYMYFWLLNFYIYLAKIISCSFSIE